MSETKTVLYKRDTVKRHLLGLIGRIKVYMDGACGKPYPDAIDDVIVFGSYLDRTKDRIHDLDVYVSFKENRRLWPEFTDKYATKRYNPIDMIMAPFIEETSYLRGGSHIISVHPYKEDLPAVLSGTHCYLVKDGILQENVVKELELF